MSDVKKNQKESKFDKAAKILTGLDIDGWLIVSNEKSDVHSPYLLGVNVYSRHYIFIGADGKHEVIASKMEAPMIKKSLSSNGIDADVIDYSTMSDITNFLTNRIRKNRIALNYGEGIFSSKDTSYADYIRGGDLLELKKLAPNAEFVSAAPIIYKMRSVKTPSELNALRKCCKVNLEILENIPEWLQIGMSEREIKAKLEYEYLKVADGISFETIVAVGPNSADPHHNTSSLKTSSDTALLIDSGIKLEQMCSDITWMWWLGNKPSEEYVRAYKTLLEAKKISNNYYISGVPNNRAAREVRKYLADNGYDHEKLFIHGLGHSIGFKEHDVGMRISRAVPDEYLLEENMVYSNEPGLYWPGKWGIRLEDIIIIGKEKPELLTYQPEDPLTIS